MSNSQKQVSFGMAINCSKRIRRLQTRTQQRIKQSISDPKVQKLSKEKDIFITQTLDDDGNDAIKISVTPKHNSQTGLNRFADSIQFKNKHLKLSEAKTADEISNTISDLSDKLDKRQSFKQKIADIFENIKNKLSETKR